jgi:uncharacterized protein (DUF952 family)
MIYHICTEAEWQNCLSLEIYFPSRYENDNFIHCSTAKQIEKIANTHYKNESKIYLLIIDDRLEKTHIKYENLDGGKELFPHIYRELPKSSISSVQKISKKANQQFQIINQ